MTADLATLRDDLAVEAVGGNRFRGSPGALALPQLFGGHVLAQALLAAAGTVDLDRRPRSLHAHFLRSGNGRDPLEHEVSVMRDGRSASTRAVQVFQGGRLLSHVVATFGPDAGGMLDHAVAVPEVPDPGDCPRATDLAETTPDVPNPWEGFAAVDVRIAGPRPGAPGVADHRDHAWMRVEDSELDALGHAALLVYCSDLTLLSSVLVPSGLVFGLEHEFSAIMGAVSLDHAVWFHRPARVDDWLLFEQRSPVGLGDRGLATAQVFDRPAGLVATVVQEVMVR